MTPSELTEALEVLQRSGVVSAPTDTLVGLLARAREATAVSRVLAIKGAERQAPLPVLVADLEMALSLSERFPESARELAARGWPGPMTLIVLVRPGVFPAGVTAGRSTVGLRVPGPSPALDIVRALGEPLTGTSANRSGHVPPQSSAALDPAVASAVDLVIAGTSPVGLASTVIDVTGEKPSVLRQGSFRLEGKDTSNGHS